MTRCVTTKGEALLSRGISHSDTALKRSELLQHHGVLVLRAYLADVPCDSWKSNKGAPEFLLRLLVPRYASSKPYIKPPCGKKQDSAIWAICMLEV